MIKKIAWDAFKNTGDINTFLEYKQIQNLESELGYKLLIREKRTFTLTLAGKYIYHQSKNIIENIQEMQEKAKFIASNNNYSIKIGY